MSDNPQKDQQQAVLCDMCRKEDRKPARKTCMKCEISMCVHHLQAHLTTPVLLQTHPLTEPMAPGEAGLGGTTKCPQHGKLLEYYCLDDLTSVCVSCAIEDQHRLHNMKTLSTAHTELMTKLNAEQRASAKTEDESLERWEKVEREKLGRSSVRLIEAVSKLRDIALASVQNSVSARMVAIRTSQTSMQAAQNEKDSFRFLQMFSQVHQDVEKAKAVDLRKGLEPGNARDKLVQELKQGGEKMVEQAVKLSGSLLILVDPENHQEVFSTKSGLSFDPQTLGTGMSLSEDHRKVFYSRWLGQRAAHTLQIRNGNAFTNFQRWMVSFSKNCDWAIGLYNKESAKNFKDGHVYGLCCHSNELSSLTTHYDDPRDGPMNFAGLRKIKMPKTRIVSSQLIEFPGENGAEIMPRPQNVEVHWNFAASSLSFFSSISQYQRIEILTIKMSHNSCDLIPFVHLGEDKAPKSSNRPTGKLIVGAFGMQTLFDQLQQLQQLQQPQQRQQQWKCICGQGNPENKGGYGYAGYRHSGYGYSESSKATCSCGAVIGSPIITEVLCELL